MGTEYSIVRQDRFIEATRDSGYKGTDSALSELIDNSIQASATSVAIEFLSADEGPSGPGRPKQPRVTQVVIADNGRGMDAETLRRSLRFGDSSRFGDRSGLGRFGMGLPNASVSQCKRVEVYSWRKGSKPLFTYIDVVEIASGDLEEVPEPVETPIPPELQHLASSTSGTVVVWKQCDRLDHDGKIDTLMRALKSVLGRIFRYFLIRDFDLTIGGSRVGPMDPMFLMPQARIPGDLLATQHGDALKFQVPIPGKPDQFSTVEALLSLLPAEWQIKYGPNKTAEQKEGMKARSIESTTGYSIVRADREIDLISSPYHAMHWKNRWYRVEIRFEPELDEVFGVTHTKQHARIARGSQIFNQIGDAIKANVNTLLDIIEHRKPKKSDLGPKESEELVLRVAPRLKPLDAVIDKKPIEVREEIAAFVQERVQAGASPEIAECLDLRLSQFPVVIELEQLPGAPIFRSKVVGRTIVVMLNTSHVFYERVYQRLERESPLGKTGVDLLFMSLARSEVSGSDEARDWYDEQRQDWSQNLKLFTSQLPEYEDPGDSNGSALEK